MRICLATLLMLVAQSLARADEAIPAKTLTDIKGATVFIKVAAGPVRASGSGFLFRVEGETGYLITNHHVVVLDAPGLPPPRLTAVFWSGTKKEQSHPLELLGSDPERDLAVLKVTGVKELPTPLDLSQKVELTETLPVFMIGFPFGQALSLTPGNPAITIGKGTISSIRTNDLDQVALVQIDGDLNPGNSGGPVVDGKGRLVGVAVARLRGTRIGMAIPGGELQRMLAGRVVNIRTTWKPVSETEVDVEIETGLIDPLRKMKSVEILYLPAADLKEKPKADRDTLFTAIPNAQKVTLKIDGQTARGTVRLRSKEKGRVLMAYQTTFVQGEGKKLITAVVENPVEFGENVVGKPPMGIPNPPPIALKDRVTQMMPGVIKDVVVGAGGRFLILHVAEKRKLVVWDTYLSKVAKELPLAADHVKFAAGADSLIVALPTQKLIQRYSLKTFERETTAPLRLPGQIKGMAMGSASAGPLALAVLHDQTGAELIEFMDPLTLKSIDTEWPMNRRVGVTGDFLRASANGQVFTARQGIGSEPHSCVAVMPQGRTAKVQDAWISGSLLLPSPDGQIICADCGVYGRDMKIVFPREASKIIVNPFLPAQQGIYFMRFESAGEKDRGKLSLHVPGHDRPFVVIDQVEGYIGSGIAYGRIPSPLMHDKRVFLIPEAKVLITIPQTDDRLLVRPVDLDQLLTKAPFDVLFVASQPRTTARPGMIYSYQISAKSNKGGLKFKLESAPAGMKITPQGLLEWDVPTKLDKLEHDVVVGITDAAGQECLHSFTLTVEK